MNLHIVRNAVTHDSRVLKATSSLANAGLFKRVEICGFHEPGFSLEEDFGTRRVRRIRLRTRGLPKDLGSQFVKYAEWYAQIIRDYRHAPLKVIHCHDLGPLPIAVRLKQITGAKLVYDAHELESEMAGRRGLRQVLARRLEAQLLRYVDAMLTVSPSIRAWYGERFPHVPISLVRNIPARQESAGVGRPLRSRLGVPDDALLFIYLGGLNRGRGIEIALEAFNGLGVRHHVLFMGSGPLRAQIEAMAGDCKRIHYLPPVPPGDVLSYTAGADGGLCLYEDTCLNHRYCLPNKLFECLLAGLPVLASELPDQAAIVRAYTAGWVVPNEAQAVAKFLKELDVKSARALRAGLPWRVADLSWENEAAGLLGVYRKLLCVEEERCEP